MYLQQVEMTEILTVVCKFVMIGASYQLVGRKNYRFSPVLDLHFNFSLRLKLGLQCFDAVGWASGRASGL